MLTDLSKQVAHCYSRAAECSERAATCSDPDTKDFYVQREKAWLALAQNHELSERIGSALDERQRQRLRKWPATIRTIPNCPTCKVGSAVDGSAFFVCTNCHQIVEQVVSVVTNCRV